MSNSKPTYEELIIENEKLKKLVSEKTDIDISLINSLTSLHEEDTLKGLQFKAALENMTKGIFITDKEGNFINFNTAFSQFHRYKSKEDCPKTINGYYNNFEGFLPSGEPLSLDEWPVVRALRGETKNNSEYLLKRTDTGEEWPCTYSFAPIVDKQGRITGSIITCEDISEQKQKEKELKENEDRLRTIINQASDAIYLCNIEGEIKITNNYACEMLGFSTNELLNMKVADLNVNIIDTNRQKEIWNKLELEKPETLLTTYKHKNGLHIPVEIRHSRINYDGYTAILAFVRDITERKLAEERLKYKKTRLNNIVESSNLGTWEWNVQTGEVICNEKWANLIGYTTEEISPISIDTWMKYAHPDDLKESDILLNKHFKRELDSYHFESRIKHKTRGWIWVLDRGKVVTWTEDGKPEWMFGTHQDITDRRKAEEKLKESEEKHRTIIETAISGFWITNKHGEFLEVNHAYCHMSGYSKNELLNMKISDVDILDSTADIKNRISHIAKKGSDHFESKHRRKDGSVYDIEINIQYQPFDDGQFICFINDISERKQSEEKLKESETKFRSLYDNAPLSYQSLNEDGSFKDINPTWLNTLGYERNEVIGKFYKDFLHPDWQANFEDKFPQFKKRGYVNDVQFKIRHKDGHYVDISFEGCIGYNPDGSFKQTYCVFTDITERKQAEEALLLNKKRYQKAQSIGHVGNWEYDLALTKFWGSEETKRIFGFKPEQEILTPESVENCIQDSIRVQKALIDLIEHDKKYDLVYDILTKDAGIKKTVRSIAALEKDTQGNPIKVTGVIIDVTKQTKVDDALSESEKMLELVMDSIPQYIFWKDINSIYLGCNDNFAKIAGLKSASEIVGKSDYDMPWKRNGANSYIEDDKKVIESGQGKFHIVERQKQADGKHAWLETNKIPMYNNSKEIIGVLGTFADITDRKKDEEEKEKIYKSIQTAVYIYDFVTNKNDYINPEYTKLLGWTADEIDNMGSKFSELFHPDDSALVAKHIQIIREDTEDNTHILEYRFKAKNGQWRWCLSYDTPFQRNMNGDVEKMIGSFIDITDRKLIELELVYQKEKAEESDRLKSAFLANMSHEIRTPMNGIMGFAELLKETELTVDQQKNYIDIIEESGTRMLNIINDIIDISKIEACLMKTDIQESNINDQIEYINTFFKPEVENKGMKLICNTTLPSEESVIKTDREKVFAILSNLVKNAVKYSNKGSIEFGYYKKGAFLEFYVTDTGIGIPKDRIEAIFERFIQADIEDKMALQGAGLGLSITKSYVEMLGGNIWVESEEGIGSTFYFTLPYHTEKIERQLSDKEILLEERNHNINSKVMNLKILIAEDDEVSASLLEIIIEKFSDQIITATNGFEAIEICRNNPDIDLILMDVKMPGLDGYRATEQIRQFNKDVLIIAQTAYGLIGDKEKAIEAGCNEYIAKPINTNVLHTLIQKHF